MDDFIREYRSSLEDLTFNSKPLINVLTMLAEEHAEHSAQIVATLEAHIFQAKPNCKLAALYLMDSIIKNVPESNYKELFLNNIVSTFSSVFEKVDERTRASMYKLRVTWTQIFPNDKLFRIDTRVNQIDPAWPINAQPSPTNIHVNPKFLKNENDEDTAAIARREALEKQKELHAKAKEEAEKKAVEIEKRLKQEQTMKEVQVQLLEKEKELFLLNQRRLEIEKAEGVRKQENSSKNEAENSQPKEEKSMINGELKKKHYGPTLAESLKNDLNRKGKDRSRSLQHCWMGKNKSRSKSPRSPPRRERKRGGRRDFSPDGQTGRSRLAKRNRHSDNIDRSRLPPIPKLDVSYARGDLERSNTLPSPLPSPNQRGWAAFKADRPSKFPTPTVPSLLDQFPLARPQRAYARKTSKHTRSSGIQNIPRQLQLQNASETVQNVTAKLNAGEISHEEHQEFLKQLSHLYNVQQEQETSLDPRRNKRNATSAFDDHDDEDLREHQSDILLPQFSPEEDVENPYIVKPAEYDSLGDVDMREISAADVDLRDIKAQNDRMDAEKNAGEDNSLSPARDVDFRELRSSNSPLNDVDMRRDVVLCDEVPYDTEKFYIPMHDPRWLKPNSANLLCHELMINGESYPIRYNGSQHEIVLFNTPVNVRACPKSKKIFVSSRAIYTIGKPPVDCVINGRKVFLFFRGRLANLWIDGFKFQIRLDAPAEKIHVASKDCQLVVHMDSTTQELYVNGHVVCKYDQGPKKMVMIGRRTYELYFVPPSKRIAIDRTPCELTFKLERPSVILNDVPRGICFDGPPRHVLLNDRAWLVPVDKPIRIWLPEDGSTHTLALGGPGHEVIVDGEMHEVKFDQPMTPIQIGLHQIGVRLPGEPPEVKILGEYVLDEALIRKLIGNYKIDLSSQVLDPQVVKSEWSHIVAPSVEQMHDTRSAPRFTGPRDLQPQFVPSPRVMGQQARFNPRSAASRYPFRGPLSENFPDRPENFHADRPLASGPDFRNPQMPGVDMRERHPYPFADRDVLRSKENISSLPLESNSAPVIDVNDLLSKLLSAGILNRDAANDNSGNEQSSDVKPKLSVPKKKELEEPLPSLVDFNLDKFKVRYGGIIPLLYDGVICTSCGSRFTTKQVGLYREHLNWHFRRNKRQKSDIKVSKHQQYAYGVEEWIQFAEVMGDEMETSSSVFSVKKSGSDRCLSPESSRQASAKQAAVENNVIRNPPASSTDVDNHCKNCGDPFSQVFNEDEEEWQLQGAVLVNGILYHEDCYEESQEVTLDDSTSESPVIAPNSPKLTNEKLPEPVLEVIKKEDEEDLTIKSEQLNDLMTNDHVDDGDSVNDVEIKSETSTPPLDPEADGLVPEPNPLVYLASLSDIKSENS